MASGPATWRTTRPSRQTVRAVRNVAVGPSVVGQLRLSTEPSAKARATTLLVVPKSMPAPTGSRVDRVMKLSECTQAAQASHDAEPVQRGRLPGSGNRQ